VTGTETQRTVETVWRMESARLIAGLVRMVRDVALAEDLAQDALVAALSQWPESGVPSNPGAWLMAIAKRRAVDHFRRAERLERKQAELGHELELDQESFMPDFDTALEGQIEDDMLRLMFICCHPVLPTEARVALTLRLLGGLTTKEIARSFLTSEATIGQRIVRAKRNLGEARVPFEVPSAQERAQRLGSVLEVLYLVFNEGYSATAGDDWMRPALCEEALRLGRMLAGLAPEEPEVHGLIALMEIQASRSAARVGPFGEPILLLDQNRALGSTAHPPWPQGARPRRVVGRNARTLRPAGRNRRVPRAGAYARSYRLGADRSALRCPFVGGAVAGRRTESGGRTGNGVRTADWPRTGGPVGRDAVAEGLPPAA
jgi:RNA polymerase sigma factor (sigma-70 family)